jgi:type I restriction enzyme S subunit
MGRIGSTYGGLTGKVKADFGRGDAKYVTFLNVLQNVTIDPFLFEPVNVPPEEHQNRVLKGDLLFNGTSETPEEVALASVLDAEVGQLFLNSFCFGFRLGSPQLHDAKFLAYFFRGPVGRQLMSALAQGATRYNMSKRQFLSLPLALPSPAEQRAIAEALSDADRLLGALEALIAKKRAIKQAAMQQLLTGKTRLPGFGGEWAELNMAADSILKARIGWQGLTTSEYLSTGEHYLVTGTDFVNGRIDWTTCHFVNRDRFVQDRNIQLNPGDVLLTKDGTIGKAGYVETLPGPATLNSGVFVIRPKNDAYIPLYMHYVLTSRIFDKFLARLQAGSTITHLYQKDFVGFAFDAPSREEQAAIATALSEMDAEIAALEARRDKTSAIKQGMMQQLLTGRVRLVKPEAAA